MSKEDFDVAALAKYLHITPQQVEKLADRGKVPGRRVQGRWRFSSAEIHHWMEERMGLLDEGELHRVEGVLSQASQQERNFDDGMLPLSRMLLTASIGIPLAARTKRSVIEEMVELAMHTGMLWDPNRMRDAVHAREELRSTALPNGIALLHPRRPLSNILGEPLLALGVSPPGIPFGGSRGLTQVFFLIASTDERGHLHTLARLTRMIQTDDFAERLLVSEDAPAVKKIFDATEAELKA